MIKMEHNLETIKNAYKKYYSTLPTHAQAIHPLWQEIKDFEKELREKLPNASHNTKYFAWEVIEEILG